MSKNTSKAAQHYQILKNLQDSIQNIQNIEKNKENPAYDQPHPLLGGLSLKQFMQEYWQKKPLFVPAAIPNYPQEGLITQTELLELADDFELPSRFVQYQNNTWQCEQGLPEKLPKHSENWTILVQKVNTASALIQQFMQLFNFLPYARLDDVMISFATANAGIGAHVDSYDVFLFQGMGERVWETAAHFSPELEENAPLKLLKNFQTEQSYHLKAGDMLYLPPNYAHRGTAITEAMTYSVGFRAPRADELLHEYFMEQIAFIESIKESAPELLPETLYTDADHLPNSEPARIPAAMVNFLQKHLDALPKMSASQLLGIYLTRPAMLQNQSAETNETNEINEANEDIDEENDDLTENIGDSTNQDLGLLSPAEFGKQENYYLAYHAQILYDESNLYLQGEIYPWHTLTELCDLNEEDMMQLKYFANHKSIQTNDFSHQNRADKKLKKGISPHLKRLLFSWYQDDYVWIG